MDSMSGTLSAEAIQQRSWLGIDSVAICGLIGVREQRERERFSLLLTQFSKFSKGSVPLEGDRNGLGIAKSLPIL